MEHKTVKAGDKVRIDGWLLTEIVKIDIGDSDEDTTYCFLDEDGLEWWGFIEDLEKI